MNLCVLRYAQYDKVKPIYHLAEGDKFLLTAKINRDGDHTTSHINGFTGTVSGSGAGKILVNMGNGPQWQTTNKDRENGLYFVKVVMNKKPVWQYTYTGYRQKYASWFEMEYMQELLNSKGDSGVIENKVFYKSMREEQMKDYFVLYE